MPLDRRFGLQPLPTVATGVDCERCPAVRVDPKSKAQNCVAVDIRSSHSAKLCHLIEMRAGVDCVLHRTAFRMA
jgi:hypothetical protein